MAKILCVVQVIAFICGFFAAILLVMGLASSEWLIATDYRQGKTIT